MPAPLTDSARQAAYSQALEDARKASLALEERALTAFRDMSVELGKKITEDIRYIYDQERAAGNLAAAIQDLKARASADLEAIWPGFEAELRKNLRNAEQLGLEATDRMLETLGETVGGPLARARADELRLLSQFSADLIQNVKADVLRSVNTSLQLGVLGGKSPTALISDLMNVLPTTGTRFDNMVAGPLYRAEAIVRTELARIHSQAQQMRAEQYQSEGIDVIKVWQHTGTGVAHPRAGHIAMNGQEKPVDKPFVNPITGNKLMMPQDPAAPAEETVNCGCRMLVTTNRFRHIFQEAA